MRYHILADLVVLIHLGFILFAVFGGFVVLSCKRFSWVHLPAVLWAALVEFMGWVCPLTPLENWLREQGGGSGYRASFVEHHILPILYPDSLATPSRIALGFFVLGINLGVYGWALRRRMKMRS